ncbi:MAG: hypothetical protein HPAVJP_4270 [Candidatus Hepatoplasma vulgare]|nr:MAG: hypothetical protein HPAVJP_4270 [Candidatus Hepatoplasma sp.]
MNYETKESSKKTISKSEERLKSFSDRIKKLFHSNWAFVVFISIFTVLTIAQLGYDGANGLLTNNDNNQLAIDLLIWVNAICIICSMIFTARISSWFFAFSFIGLTMLITRSILTGLPLNALKAVILFLPVLLRFIRWIKGKHAGRDINVRRMSPFLFIGIIMFVIAISYGVGYGVRNLESENLPYIDGTNFCFSLVASLLVAVGFIEGWLLTIVAAICAMLSYIFLNIDGYISLSINGIGVTIIFMFLCFGTILTWMSIYYSRNNTFKYIKKQKLEKGN